MAMGGEPNNDEQTNQASSIKPLMSAGDGVASQGPQSLKQFMAQPIKYELNLLYSQNLRDIKAKLCLPDPTLANSSL